MLNELEQEILHMLVAGNHPDLACLRNQLSLATLERREMSGVGFFTTLSLPEGAPRLTGRRSLVIGDVYAEITGLEHWAGFLLFIKDCAMDFLECFIVDDQWPEFASLQRAFYVHHPTPATREVVETKERDLNILELDNSALNANSESTVE